jgi:hypothetical protein
MIWIVLSTLAQPGWPTTVSRDHLPGLVRADDAAS